MSDPKQAAFDLILRDLRPSLLRAKDSLENDDNFDDAIDKAIIEISGAIEAIDKFQKENPMPGGGK